ncbi:hypothetical protein PV328_012420, partial [Microctonus aethiopoides]
MSGTISKKLCQASYYWEGADVGFATLMCKINFGSPGWSKRVRRLSQYEIAILKRHQCEVSNYVETVLFHYSSLLFDDRNVQVVEDELERFRVRSERFARRRDINNFLCILDISCYDSDHFFDYLGISWMHLGCWGERHPATDFEDLLWCYEGAIYLFYQMK